MAQNLAVVVTGSTGKQDCAVSPRSRISESEV